MIWLGKDFTFSVDYWQKLNQDKNNPKGQEYDNAIKMHGELQWIVTKDLGEVILGKSVFFVLCVL